MSSLIGTSNHGDQEDLWTIVSERSRSDTVATSSKDEKSAAGGQKQGLSYTDNDRLQQWDDFGHEFEAGELELLKRSIAEMALSRIDGQDDLYVGGIWALRRSDSLTDRHITHVLSMVAFNPDNLKNFKDEPWTAYGKDFEHLVLDIDDVDDADLVSLLPQAVKFIDEGLRGSGDGVELHQNVDNLSLEEQGPRKEGGVFVHCAAGKSRSVAATVAYLLWRYPNRFDPNITPTSVSDATSASASASASPVSHEKQSRKDTAEEAVGAALAFVRRTRPMAEPNEGFMAQLALWWEMGCPDDVEAHPAYQRWAYKREVDESLAVGQAPSRLRFEDEEAHAKDKDGAGLQLRCKKCRRTMATAPFIIKHQPRKPQPQACQHIFVEPLSWMRGVLEQGALNGRLVCPNAKCGAGVGRYDWKGFRCSCGAWVTPAFSLQRAKVDDVEMRPASLGQSHSQNIAMGIRMPPGARRGNL